MAATRIQTAFRAFK
nr:hypothetical protein [Tanacetum cinerariifolium]